MTSLTKAISNLRLRAKGNTDKMAFDYIDGGAEDEITLKACREQWRRLKLIPRVWTGPTSTPVDTSCNLLGHDLAAPLLIAPMALHRWMHEEGEIATARAAEKCKLPMCVSFYCSRDIEDIKESGQNPVMFQHLCSTGRTAGTRQVLKEICRQGCRVIVVSVDTPVVGQKLRDAHIRNGSEVRNKDLRLFSKENYWKGVFSTSQQMQSHLFNEGGYFEWNYISWIKYIVDVKGILSPMDAELAVKHGADGIIVSNHGGRQLDTAVTAVDVLPSIAKAVDGRIPILTDGGIQRGTDIIKALALGASAVLIGRPVLYALAAGGADEVELLLDGLIKEFQKALALCGCKHVKDITSDLVFHPC